MQLDIETLAVESFSILERETEPSTGLDTNTGPGGQYTLCYICPGSANCNTGANVC